MFMNTNEDFYLKLVKETILKSRQEGDLLGVKSTPSYLVNDKFIVGSTNLKLELDSLLQHRKL